MDRFKKEDLERLILVEKLSYIKIGELYGCSYANIKRAAKKLGIDLPIRKIHPTSRKHNKGVTKKVKNCKYCNVKLNNTYKVYCNNTCQQEHRYTQFIEKWKAGNESGVVYVVGISNFIRRYLFRKYDNQCCLCGWNEINSTTNKIPLHVHHIDGNCQNNSEDNLQLLCPNCHSLTDNYGNLNDNGRIKIKSKYAEVV